MDVFTQAILGGVAAQSTLQKEGANPPSKSSFVILTLAGMLGGWLPDWDVLIRSNENPMVAWYYHRHFSHSFIFIPLGALLSALLVWIFVRKKLNFKPIYLASLVGIATHGLLDACTSYGTLLFWPFTQDRISWDFISIVDPVFTFILLGGLIAAWKKVQRRFARIALGFAFIYLGFGAFLHHQAALAQQAILKQRGQVATRARVMPTFGNLMVWRSLYEADGEYQADAISVRPFSKVRYWEGPKVKDPLPKILALNLPPQSQVVSDILVFQWFTEGYYGLYSQNPWVLADLRYSLVPNRMQPLWGIEFDPEHPEKPVKKKKFPGNRFQRFPQYWQFMFGEEVGVRFLEMQ